MLPLRQEVKDYAGDKQSDRKVDEHNVLRVFRKQCCSDVKGVQVSFSVYSHSLDDNFRRSSWGESSRNTRYSPGLVNVKENFSSVSSTLDLNTLSVLTTVCGMSSRLIQVTVAPTETVMAAGPKRKIVDFHFRRGRRFLLGAWPQSSCGSAMIPPRLIIAVATKLAANTLLLMIFLPLFLF